MNNPDAASEQIAETTGAEPDTSLNPHLGHMVPDEPDGEQKPEQDAQTDKSKDGEAPSPGEDNADTQPDDPKPGDGLQKKVGELAFENRQLKRQLEQRQAEPEVTEQPEPLKTLKDFGYDEQAFNEYLVEETSARTARKLEGQRAQEQGETESQRLADEFAAREEAFEAENPGFKERLHAEDLPISQEMAMFISDPESDVGLHVGDYLSQNKAEAARIAGLNPTAQFREMTKLETRIGGEIAKAKAEKNKASNAPEPPSTTIDGTDPGIDLDPANPADADNMSDEEWQRRRNKQLEARRNKK